jgi:hypothetical protein
LDSSHSSGSALPLWLARALHEPWSLPEFLQNEKPQEVHIGVGQVVLVYRG